MFPKRIYVHNINMIKFGQSEDERSFIYVFIRFIFFIPDLLVFMKKQINRRMIRFDFF